MASSLNGTGLTFSSGATLNSPPVTSVATGNGLSGGTITTTGTLAIAAPSFNSVGSYSFAYKTTSGSIAAGNTVAGSALLYCDVQCPDGGPGGSFLNGQGNLSGTWRAMSNGTGPAGGYLFGIIWCRVS